MTVELSAVHRDALFGQIMHEVDVFDDLRRSLEKGDLEQAYRLGRVITDGFRLIVDGGLGWAKRTTEPVVLQLPPDDLRALLTRKKLEFDSLHESLRPDREETQREWDEVDRARDACAGILAQI